MTQLKLMICLILASFLIGCGGTEDSMGGHSNDNETTSTLAVKMRGAQFAEQTSYENRSSAASTPSNCTISTTNLGMVDGLCLTPSRIGGHVAQVSLSRNAGGPPARLLGGTLGLEQDASISAQDFNLDSATALLGDDNVQDDTMGTNWDYMAVNFATLDVQVPINSEYWNIRYAFITTPVINDSVIDGCIVEELGNEGEQDEEGLAEESENESENEDMCANDPNCGEGSYRSQVTENAKLYDALEIYKGDVLLCIKSDETLCADNEFQWLDLGSNSLVSTRPSAPYQIDEIVNTATVCDPPSDGPGYDIQLGGFDMFATIRTPFSLTAEFINAQKLYTFSINNTPVAEGIDMTLFIDFDVVDAMFIEGASTTSIGDATTVEILQSAYLSAMFATLNAPEGDLNTDMVIEFNAALEGEPDPFYCPPEDDCLDDTPP